MSKLYLVPTPIGNLEDITFRAIRILKEVNFILSEDTRRSGILLKHYNINNKLISHHKFNEHKLSEQIAERINNGETAALISDAGTPGISDPGYLIVKKCIEKDIVVECLPGANAIIPAIAMSGLPNDRFVFEGFLPVKKGRKTRLAELANEKRTMVFFESPHRLAKTLADFILVFGEERLCSVCREISKIHEENKRGTLQQLHKLFSEKKAKGEVVIIVDGIKK